jgi:hypothetical protein
MKGVVERSKRMEEGLTEIAASEDDPWVMEPFTNLAKDALAFDPLSPNDER